MPNKSEIWSRKNMNMNYVVLDVETRAGLFGGSQTYITYADYDCGVVGNMDYRKELSIFLKTFKQNNL